MLHIGEVSVDFSRFSRQFSVIITMEADIAPVEECRSLSVKSGQHFDCLAQRKCDRYWLTDRQTDTQFSYIISDVQQLVLVIRQRSNQGSVENQQRTASTMDVSADHHGRGFIIIESSLELLEFLLREIFLTKFTDRLICI